MIPDLLLFLFTCIFFSFFLLSSLNIILVLGKYCGNNFGLKCGNNKYFSFNPYSFNGKSDKIVQYFEKLSSSFLFLSSYKSHKVGDNNLNKN